MRIMIRRKSESHVLGRAPSRKSGRAPMPQKAPASGITEKKNRKSRLELPSTEFAKLAASPLEMGDGSSTQKQRMTLTVNGVKKQVAVAPWTTLLDELREYMDLTGTKKGCDHGQCGACTVLVDGKRVLSCLTLAIMKDGAEVTTIEGLAEGEVLHALQEAFMEHDAFQCGYCTPGQICSAVGMILEG